MTVRFQVRGLLTTAEMGAEMRGVELRQEIVSPQGAATIASWWQSPGSWSGAVFAAFASGRDVSREDLLNATDAEIGMANADDQDAQAFLGALRDFCTAPLCETCGKLPQAGGMFEAECVDCYLSE